LVEVHGPQDFERAIATARTEQADALIVPASGVFVMDPTRIAILAVQNRLPTLGPIREFAEAGCLMTYGPNTADMFWRAAIYVDKILKGAKPADIPWTAIEIRAGNQPEDGSGLASPSATRRAQADELINDAGLGRMARSASRPHAHLWHSPCYSKP
jgi:putative ABC transport system substrate-binding protein